MTEKFNSLTIGAILSLCALAFLVGRGPMNSDTNSSLESDNESFFDLSTWKKENVR